MGRLRVLGLKFCLAYARSPLPVARTALKVQRRSGPTRNLCSAAAASSSEIECPLLFRVSVCFPSRGLLTHLFIYFADLLLLLSQSMPEGRLAQPQEALREKESAPGHGSGPLWGVSRCAISHLPRTCR